MIYWKIWEKLSNVYFELRFQLTYWFIYTYHYISDHFKFICMCIVNQANWKSFLGPPDAGQILASLFLWVNGSHTSHSFAQWRRLHSSWITMEHAVSSIFCTSPLLTLHPPLIMDLMALPHVTIISILKSVGHFLTPITTKATCKLMSKV